MVKNDRILKAAPGEIVDRPPVWMMRQAGRYMKVYRDLREKYPSFRQRSETPELAIEISLRPFQAFRPDGVILFSDILTPLPGLGINFDIVESKGPMIDPPIRTQAQIDALHEFTPEQSLPFMRQILTGLRQAVNDQATVIGFVGAPWTLTAYAVEGKSSHDYTVIKQMAYTEPELLHRLLGKLAAAIETYVIYQIDSGAEGVQIFDSWAGQLSPRDYETFALPYEKLIVDRVRAKHPQAPLIPYINGSAGILDRLPHSGVDVVSLDWMVDTAEARLRLGQQIAV